MRKLELTGFKSGKLTAIKMVEANKTGQRFWLCLCDCGRESKVIGSQLKHGRVLSCGCLIGAHRRNPNKKNIYAQPWKRGFGKAELEHRTIYEAAFGPIPEGYVIHHINHDPTDNRIENLQMMIERDHLRTHQKSFRKNVSDVWEKFCSRCSTWKVADTEFYRKRKNGVRCYCKECNNVR